MKRATPNAFRSEIKPPKGSTVGPWYADSHGEIKRVINSPSGQYLGTQVLDGEFPSPWAAAEEMLAALIFVQSLFHRPELRYRQDLITNDEREKIHMAVEKAGGKQLADVWR